MKRTPPNKPKPKFCEVPDCNKAPTRVLGGYWFCDEHGNRDYESTKAKGPKPKVAPWTVTERTYHGVKDGQFIVHLEGAQRGPIETDDRAAADRIAAALNACDCHIRFTGMRLDFNRPAFQALEGGAE